MLLGLIFFAATPTPPGEDTLPPAPALDPFAVIDQTGHLQYRTNMNMRSRVQYSCPHAYRVPPLLEAKEEDWTAYRAIIHQDALDCIAIRYRAFVQWCNTHFDQDPEERRDCAEAKRNINFIP